MSASTTRPDAAPPELPERSTPLNETAGPARSTDADAQRPRDSKPGAAPDLAKEELVPPDASVLETLGEAISAPVRDTAAAGTAERIEDARSHRPPGGQAPKR